MTDSDSSAAVNCRRERTLTITTTCSQAVTASCLARPTAGCRSRNMLMTDRITRSTDDGGKYGKGRNYQAELDIKPDLWFFDCHFEGDPVMPGCLGLDALWQLVGFHLVWQGLQGRGRALGVGKVKFTGQILADGESSSLTRSTSSASFRANSTWRLPTAQCPSMAGKSTRPRTCASACLLPLTTSRDQSMRRALLPASVPCPVSAIRNKTIVESLRHGRSGIVANECFKEMGLRSQVSGSCHIDIKEHIDRKVLRFMGDCRGLCLYRHAAGHRGCRSRGSPTFPTFVPASSRHPVARQATTSSRAPISSRERGVRKIGPYRVPRTMGSSVSACLATPFKIKGVNYLDHVGLRDQRALHRRGGGADPARQAGYRVCRRRRRRTLVAGVPVRRYGRAVVKVQR